MANSVVIGHDLTTQQNVSISEEARQRSTYVIGKPGSGKSTLLENIAVQDIANGDGLCFLDPHGDSIENILRCIPPERVADVIYWNPADIECPFGLNPFFCTNRENALEVDQRVENFLSALASLEEFAEVFKQAPRMLDILRHLAFAFILKEGYTLIETPRFLLQQEFRERFYPAMLAHNRADILEFWQLDFDELTARERREVASSSLNKLRRLTTTTMLRLIFGQEKNSIDFRNVMDTGRILLVTLHNLGEGNAEVIGAFIVWGILSAAYGRGEIHGPRRQFHLIADEFQRFSSTAFPRLIEEGRKYGVDTVVAHQHRGQLEGQTLGATLTAPNRVVFLQSSNHYMRGLPPSPLQG